MKAISTEVLLRRSLNLQLAESQERHAAELRSDAEESARDGDTVMQAILLRGAEEAKKAAAAFREAHERMVADLR